MMAERTDTLSAYWVRFFLDVGTIYTFDSSWFCPHLTHVLGISIVY